MYLEFGILNIFLSYHVHVVSTIQIKYDLDSFFFTSPFLIVFYSINKMT